MHKVWLLSLAGALVLAMIGHNPASALTADELITTIGTDPNVPVEYAQRRGYRGGGYGRVGYRGGRAVAYRGYGRRAVAVGGTAYYGSRSCPQYTYGCPPYYYGRQAYRGAYYRGGRAVYRGGYRGARVAHYRGGGRRR